MSLLHLPDDVLEKILSFISYDEISRNRLVCRRMNSVCKRALNRGFHKVERYHAQCLKHVKSQLPRRESERRKHPLARHSDILTAVETRLSLLGMTFMKFMELNLCCFIPGKVLDEIYRVLRYVTAEQSPMRAHEVLQELRDLSSMAMEHFDEKISPVFRKSKENNPKIIAGINIFAPSTSAHRASKPSTHQCSSRKCHRFQSETQRLAQRHYTFQRELQGMKQKVVDVQRCNTELEKKMQELQNLVSTQMEKMKEQDLKIEFLLGNFKPTQKSLPSSSEVVVKTNNSSSKNDTNVPSSVEMKDSDTPLTDNVASKGVLGKRHSLRSCSRARKLPKLE